MASDPNHSLSDLAGFQVVEVDVSGYDMSVLELCPRTLNLSGPKLATECELRVLITANFGGSGLYALLQSVHYIVAVVALPPATLNGPNCQVRKCPCTHAEAVVSR